MTDEQMEQMIEFAYRKGCIDGRAGIIEVIRKQFPKYTKEQKEAMGGLVMAIAEFTDELQKKLNAEVEVLECEIKKELEKCDDQG